MILLREILAITGDVFGDGRAYLLLIWPKVRPSPEMKSALEDFIWRAKDVTAIEDDCFLYYEALLKLYPGAEEELEKLLLALEKALQAKGVKMELRIPSDCLVPEDHLLEVTPEKRERRRKAITALCAHYNLPETGWEEALKALYLRTVPCK